MIKNDTQYRLTAEWAARFAAATAEIEATPPRPNTDLVLRKAYLDAAHSQLEDLRQQLAAYEASEARVWDPVTQEWVAPPAEGVKEPDRGQ